MGRMKLTICCNYCLHVTELKMSQNNEGTQDINKNVDEIGEKLKILVEYKKAYDRGEEVTEEQLAYIINDITDKFLEMESILGVNLYNKLLSKSNGCSDYVELLCMLRSGIQV